MIIIVECCDLNHVNKVVMGESLFFKKSYFNSLAIARPACLPVKRQPPTKVPSSER